jgi:hypothetical protein
MYLRTRMAPAVLRRLDDGLGLFVRAGLTPDESVRAFNALSNFTRAFVLVEHGMQAEVVTRDMLDDINRTLAARAAELPLLSTVSDINAPLGDEHYRLGLRLLIAGIKRSHRSLGTRPARRPARAGAR